MEPRSSRSQEPATGPYPEPDESSPYRPTLRNILILCSHLGLSLPSGLAFPPKPCMHSSSLLCVLDDAIFVYNYQYYQ
jgi:hypothetical protein